MTHYLGLKGAVSHLVTKYSFLIIGRVVIAEECQIWHVFTSIRRCGAGAKWPSFWLRLSIESVNVRPRIHRFQHRSLCLCLHHRIASVLVSCFCNFRQPAGSFHLLNWSRLPVLKLASCFLESRLFSSHLVLFPCASANVLGHSVIERRHGGNNNALHDSFVTARQFTVIAT